MPAQTSRNDWCNFHPGYHFSRGGLITLFLEDHIQLRERSSTNKKSGRKNQHKQRKKEKPIFNVGTERLGWAYHVTSPFPRFSESHEGRQHKNNKCQYWLAQTKPRKYPSITPKMLVDHMEKHSNLCDTKRLWQFILYIRTKRFPWWRNYSDPQEESNHYFIP